MKKILIWSSIPIAIVGVFLWSWGVAGLYGDPKPKVQLVEKIVYQKPDFPLERVAEWIFNNSKKTSRKSCLELAALVKPYKHWVLILAIVQTESEFVTSAVSTKGAQGLGQISWPVWKDELIRRGIASENRDLFYPTINIKATDHVLTILLKTHKGDIIKTLSAYVGAPGQQRYLDQIMTNYVRLSMALMEEGART